MWRVGGVGGDQRGSVVVGVVYIFEDCDGVVVGMRKLVKSLTDVSLYKLYIVNYARVRNVFKIVYTIWIVSIGFNTMNHGFVKLAVAKYVYYYVYSQSGNNWILVELLSTFSLDRAKKQPGQTR